MSDVKIKEEPIDSEAGCSVKAEIEVKCEVEVGPLEYQRTDVYYNPPRIKTELLTDAVTDGTGTMPCGGEPIVSCNTPLIRSTDELPIVKEDTEDTSRKEVKNCEPAAVTPIREERTEQHLHIESNNTVICVYCNKQFQREGTSEHNRINTADAPYVCTLCSKKFISRHMNVRIGKTPYECVVCSKKFKYASGLYSHMIIHTGEAPYECSICGKKFKFANSLHSHKILHTGAPYECSVCNKKFSKRCSLLTHSRMHTGETPYECSVCSKKFRQNHTLSRHLKIHSGETPYECSLCSRKFTQSHHVSDHMRTHTGELPYKCSVCNKRFAYKRTLYVHNKTFHSTVHSSETLIDGSDSTS